MRNKILPILLFLLIPLFLEAQKDTAGDVKKLLQLSLEELMDIKVVTASGFLQTTAEAPSTITVITSQQIADRGYEELEDALRDVPGIDMIHLNGYAPTLIYFRGMYGAENLRALLMIDGIVENNIVGSNDMAGPTYSLHNVDRIEIIWGPASALYGADAFGGVINIITKKGGDINGIKAEKGFGSFNTSFGKVSMGVRKSNFEFAVAGTLYSTDGPKFTNRDPQYSGSYVDKAHSFNGTVSYYTKKTKTTFGFRTYNTPMGWGTFFNSPTVFLHLPPQGNGNVGALGLISRDIRGEKSGLEDPFLRTAYLQNEYKTNEKFNLLTRITYRETGLGDNSYAYLTLDGKKLIRVITASFSSQVSATVAANYSLSDNQKFSAGIEYYRNNVESGSRKSTLDTNTVYLIDGRDTVTNLYSTFLPRKFDIRNNFGSYLQYILNTKLLGKTNFTAGVRYDYNSYFGDAINPRIVVVNQPDKQFTFKLQFGTAFRAPTNTEIHQTQPGVDLKTEKIKTYEINAIYTPSKNFRIQVNGFRNELRDVIPIAGLTNPDPNKNSAVININGIEAVLDMSIAKAISGFLNFTYQDGSGKNVVTHISGKVPGIAKFKGNAGATFHFTDMFTFCLTGNWVGMRRSPRTDPYGPVPGYFLTNFVISTSQLFNAKVYASVSVRNVFDVKWLDPGFRTADGVIFSTVLEQPGVNGLFKVGISL